MQTFQHNLPVFVRSRHHPITWHGKTYRYNDMFPWQELNVPVETATTLFKTDRLYHNEALEKDSKTGDRLAEFDNEMLKVLVRKVNSEIVNNNTNSKEEFNRYKVKGSTIASKQRGLVRTWLGRNGKNEEWMDNYYKIRDSILKEE